MSNRILSNRYELESELGRGGMGVVYRAQDTQVKRTVAIKTLPAIMTHNPDLMRRFQAEVQHASKLEHPNIVRVYDVGEDDGTHYYVMQYIEGSDLRGELKQRGRYAVDAALAVISQLAEALDYAHSQGIVHRDIKPENILLDAEGQAHIVDFGIAKAVEGTRMTRGLLGTPEYMSPEQVKGNRVDGRSDQYSLAVLAYELLTGRTPFPTQGDDPWAQINMHLNTPPPNPKTTVPDLPAHVANALLQALAKEPGQRFKDCGEFVKALRGEVKARVRRSQSLYGKHRILIWTTLVLAAILVVAIRMLILHNYRKSGLGGQSGITEQVAYLDQSNPKMDAICLMDPNGNNRQRLTWLERGYEINFRKLISSDARRYAHEKGYAKFEVMQTDGQGAKGYNAASFERYGIHWSELLAISPDGMTALLLGNKVGGGDSLCVVRFGNGAPQLLIDNLHLDLSGMGNSGRVSDFFSEPVFSNDSRKIAFCDALGSIWLATVQDGKWHAYNISHRDEWRQPGPAMIFSGDGSQLLVASGRPGSQSIIDLISVADRSVRRLPSPPEHAQDVWVLGVRNRTSYIAGYANETLSIYSLREGANDFQSICTVKHLHVRPYTLQLSFSGRYVVVGCGGRLRIADLDSEVCTDVGQGVPLGWVNAARMIGTAMSLTASPTEHGAPLPDGYILTSEVSDDFDRDGKRETARLALQRGGENPQLWIERDGKVVWRMSDSDLVYAAGHHDRCTILRAKARVFAEDLTGDGTPEIGVLLPINEFIDTYFFNMYQATGNTYVWVSRSLCKRGTNGIGGAICYENPLIKRVAGRAAEFDSAGSYFRWSGKEFVESGKDPFKGDYQQRLIQLKAVGFDRLIDSGLK
jgi:serine/threonine protein kinase